MKLSFNDIKKITFGAVSVAENDGYIEFNRFTEKQKQAYKLNRTISLYSKVNSASGVRFSFLTDATTFIIEYVLGNASSRNFAYFDVMVDGELIEHFGSDDLILNGEGEGRREIALKSGKKHVEMYFPFSAKVKIKSVELLNCSIFEPKKRKHTMFSYGDSITQGYDATYSSQAYVNKLALYLDADVYNKAIAGDTFFPELLENKDVIVPDIVTVAYGTNDWTKCSYEEFTFNLNAFFELLYENHKESKIIVITPVWRDDIETRFPPINISFNELRERIKKVALSYDNITVIDGDNLIPSDPNLFRDKHLHPNDEGFEYYFINLIAELKKKFN